MRRLLLPLALWLTLASPAAAQITVPFSFTAGTVANPSEVNTNFAKFADALNRTGGTMTGTLTSQQITPSASNTYDVGSAAALFRSGYLRTSLVLGQATANYTLTWANPASARAISIADPGGTDVFTFNAATQTLTNKTLTAPVLGGTVTGTYTLGGTPSFATAGFTLGGATVAQADALPGRLLFGDGTATNTALRILSGSATVLSVDAVLSNSSATEKTLAFQTNAGPTTFGGSVSFTGAAVTYPGGGSLSKNATNGLMVGGVAGSSFDFALVNPSGASGILLVPTGTLNVTFGGALTAASTMNVNTVGTVVSSFADGVKMASWDALGWDGSSTVTFGGYRASQWTAMKLYTGGTLRWGINSAGDLTFGASSHIADGAGTPTIASGFGTTPSITGTSYGFVITVGSGGVASTGVVNFGTTYSSAPVVTTSVSGVTETLISSVSTTQVNLATGGTAWVAGSKIYVIVRGF